MVDGFLWEGNVDMEMTSGGESSDGCVLPVNRRFSAVWRINSDRTRDLRRNVDVTDCNLNGITSRTRYSIIY